jgi:hypothetical protein
MIIARPVLSVLCISITCERYLSETAIIWLSVSQARKASHISLNRLTPAPAQSSLGPVIDFADPAGIYAKLGGDLVLR